MYKSPTGTRYRGAYFHAKFQRERTDLIAEMRSCETESTNDCNNTNNGCLKHTLLSSSLNESVGIISDSSHNGLREEAYQQARKKRATETTEISVSNTNRYAIGSLKV